MNMITCPWCGPRDTSEFAYAGEGNPRPDPATASPQVWRGYLYLRRNSDGWTTELWRHRIGCGTYLRVERHRTSDEVRSARSVGGDPA